MSQTYLTRIGGLIRDARRHKGMTQAELADLLGTSQGAVTRIEAGKQNLSLDTLAKIGDALDSEFVSLGHSGPQHLRIVGQLPLAPARAGPVTRLALVAGDGQQPRLLEVRNDSPPKGAQCLYERGLGRVLGVLA